jgi:hypothetical protein
MIVTLASGYLQIATRSSPRAIQRDRISSVYMWSIPRSLDDSNSFHQQLSPYHLGIYVLSTLILTSLAVATAYELPTNLEQI